jgi:hypothetical protein
MYLCERCKTHEALPGEKYCDPCKGAVLTEMKEVGYLQPLPGSPDSPFRPADAREDVLATEFGPLYEEDETEDILEAEFGPLYS